MDSLLDADSAYVQVVVYLSSYGAGEIRKGWLLLCFPPSFARLTQLALPWSSTGVQECANFKASLLTCLLEVKQLAVVVRQTRD